jgi:hypothetical protein
VWLCGVPSSETPRVGHLGVVPFGIKERAVSDASSLSGASNRPEGRSGGITDSRASSFPDGSARVYISGLCMGAWRNHRETLRISWVAGRTVSEPVCRRGLQR